MLLQIRNSPLWKQFHEKHNPPVVKTVVVDMDAYLTELEIARGSITQDEEIEYRASRRELIEKYGTQMWSVDEGSPAAQEAFWISRCTSPYRSTTKHIYKLKLLQAGYTLEEEES